MRPLHHIRNVSASNAGTSFTVESRMAWQQLHTDACTAPCSQWLSCWLLAPRRTSPTSTVSFCTLGAVYLVDTVHPAVLPQFCLHARFRCLSRIKALTPIHGDHHKLPYHTCWLEAVQLSYIQC